MMSCVAEADVEYRAPTGRSSFHTARTGYTHVFYRRFAPTGRGRNHYPCECDDPSGAGAGRPHKTRREYDVVVFYRCFAPTGRLSFHAARTGYTHVFYRRFAPTGRGVQAFSMGRPHLTRRSRIKPPMSPGPDGSNRFGPSLRFRLLTSPFILLNSSFIIPPGILRPACGRVRRTGRKGRAVRCGCLLLRPGRSAARRSGRPYGRWRSGGR